MPPSTPIHHHCSLYPDTKCSNVDYRLTCHSSARNIIIAFECFVYFSIGRAHSITCHVTAVLFVSNAAILGTKEIPETRINSKCVAEPKSEVTPDQRRSLASGIIRENECVRKPLRWNGCGAATRDQHRHAKSNLRICKGARHEDRNEVGGPAAVVIMRASSPARDVACRPQRFPQATRAANSQATSSASLKRCSLGSGRRCRARETS